MGETPLLLAQLNSDGRSPELRAQLQACCAATSWVEAILAGAPYDSDEAVYAVSDDATMALDEAGLAQALAAHPRIGERASGAEGGWSRQEQSGMGTADAGIREQIAEANRRYEQCFGQVYLVCATGLSANELLTICLDRLENDPHTERGVVVIELAKIARLRLARLIDADSPTGGPR